MSFKNKKIASNGVYIIILAFSNALQTLMLSLNMCISIRRRKTKVSDLIQKHEIGTHFRFGRQTARRKYREKRADVNHSNALAAKEPGDTSHITSAHCRCVFGVFEVFYLRQRSRRRHGVTSLPPSVGNEGLA